MKSKAESQDDTLIGRSDEIERLCGVTSSGDALRIVVVEGEAGIGKTALIEEALTRATLAGVLTLRGEADEFLQDRPLHVLLDALDSSRVAAGSAVLDAAGAAPEGSGSDAGYVMIEALVGMLSELASSAPIVVALEDLHWADVLTIRAIGTLGRRLSDLPVAVLATCRPFPRSSELERLIDHLSSLGATRLILGPLEHRHVVGIAERELGSPAGPRLRKQLEAAGGNPLFAIEMLRALRDDGAFVADRGTAEIAAPILPTDLRVAVLGRLSFLSQQTIVLLKFASVLGRDFSVTDLVTVSRETTPAVAAALMEAVRADVLGESGDRLQFRHDLIREVLYEDMPASVRKQLHREAGTALRLSGAAVEEVAMHFSLAASSGDVEAIGWIMDAAREVAHRSPRVAAGMMRRVLELSPGDGPFRMEATSELVQMLALAGEPAEAEALAQEFIPRVGEVDTAVRLRLGLAGSFLIQGRIAESLVQLEQASEQARGELKARVLADLSLRQLLSGNFIAARTTAEEALVEARKTVEVFAECEALSVLGMVSNWEGFTVDALRYSEDAVKVAAADGTGRAALAHPWGYRAIMLIYADRLDDALVSGGLAQRFAEDTGSVWGLPMAHFVVGMAHYHQGAWDLSVSECETSLTTGEELGIHAASLAAKSMMGLIALHRGDLDAAERHVSSAEQELVDPGAIRFNLQWAMLARALLLEARGDAAAAYVILSNAWDMMTMVGAIIDYGLIGPSLLRLALATGDQDTAARVASSVQDLADRSGTAATRGAALWCRGALEGDPCVFLEAAGALDSVPLPLERGLNLEQAGVVFVQRGERNSAVAPLQESLEIFENLGALRYLARVEATLRSLGVRRRRRTRPRSERSGWDSLTETELQVVELAAKGYTNKQVGAELFVSPRTVETHLGHVYSKLGVRGRAALAAQVAKRPM